jgi:hypothetical protein
MLGEAGTVLVRVSDTLARTMLEEEDQNIQLTAGRALVDLSQALSEHLQQQGKFQIFGVGEGNTVGICRRPGVYESSAGDVGQLVIQNCASACCLCFSTTESSVM